MYHIVVGVYQPLLSDQWRILYVATVITIFTDGHESQSAKNGMEEIQIEQHPHEIVTQELYHENPTQVIIIHTEVHVSCIFTYTRF